MKDSNFSEAFDLEYVENTPFIYLGFIVVKLFDLIRFEINLILFYCRLLFPHLPGSYCNQY